VSRLNEQTDEYTVATFIACIGPEVLQLYNALPFDDEQDKKKMDIVLRRMEGHCVGAIDVIYERFQFQQRRQREGETAEQYITALRALARSCEFGTTLDESVRDQVVFGVSDNALRKHLLQTRELTLHAVVDICRAFEATTNHMKVMASGQHGSVQMV
jgi:hypothetical protein